MAGVSPREACRSTAEAGRGRRREAPAGVVDRLLATLVHLRHGVAHDVLACRFGVDRSTITRAVGEVRLLLAERGCTVSPDVRLRSLAEVVDLFGASGTTSIVDGTEIRVRCPAAGRKDRDTSSLARTSRTPSSPWSSRTAKAACCGAARPVPQAGRASPTPTS
ncbi:transposase family protein [Streptomyces sp. NPDC002120]|uniref:helix-turn-helix domain-containing protein n=1 Tax=Streptomyces sp. NPDC002120 TaxID=3364631 RepID=UPI0036C45119